MQVSPKQHPASEQLNGEIGPSHVDAHSQKYVKEDLAFCSIARLRSDFETSYMSMTPSAYGE